MYLDGQLIQTSAVRKRALNQHSEEFFCNCTTLLVVSGSTFDHLTDRLVTEKPFVNFVQLAQEEEERMERRICAQQVAQEKIKDRRNGNPDVQD